MIDRWSTHSELFANASPLCKNWHTRCPSYHGSLLFDCLVSSEIVDASMSDTAIVVHERSVR